MKRVTRNLPSGGPDQQCSKCDEIKPRVEFYVKYPATGKLFPWCKACHKKKQTKVKPSIVRGQPRTCRKCGTEKPDADFRPERWICNACEKERDRLSAAKAQIEFRSKHRSKLAAAAAEKYRSDPVAGAAAVRRRRVLNPDTYNAIGKKWQHAHRDNGRAKEHLRKARLIGNGGTWTPNEWQMCKDKFDYTCLWCRRREPDIKLSPDHVIPLARGGRNSIENIQPLCWHDGNRKTGCNYRKHAKEFDLRPYWPGPNPEYVTLPDGSLFYLIEPVFPTSSTPPAV